MSASLVGSEMCIRDSVDELRYIEHELGLVSEDAMEAFDLEDEEAKNIVRLARIRPKAVLTGEEE